MSRNQRLVLVAAAAVVAIAAFAIARSGGSDNSKSGSSGSQSAVRQVQVRGGKPVGGIQRIVGTKDRRLRIVVSSDKPDVVHLHGYNIEKKVTPAAPARFSFVPNVEGVFEMEVHSNNAQIARLVVNPS
jgi:hypothetical protein